MPTEGPCGRGTPRALTQSAQFERAVDATKNGCRKKIRAAAPSGSKASVLSILQPLGDTTGGERDSRYSGRGCLQTNQAERLGPDAGNHECVRAREEPCTSSVVLPSCELDRD